MGERALLAGRFELGPPIGSGGFGTVFRARDHSAAADVADVAIKLVPHGFGSEPLAARLRREADLLGRIASRHVARVVGAGEDPARGVWLAMELVDGVPLAPSAIGRPLLPHEVLRVARGVLDGLAAAHGAGVVHGDLKPANVLVPLGTATLDAPKLIDFGLGRATSRATIADEIGPPAPRDGLVIGTPRWMAPEVLAGAPISPRSDVYAVGLLLFELLGVGELFPVDDPRARLRARLAADPELITRVPPPLSDVLARMLARDPARRYADARQAHEAVVDLDTAPVSVVRGEEAPASIQVQAVSFPPPPGSMRPTSSLRPRAGSAAPAAPRLATLPADPAGALRDTIRHLDLPMLDALARRERGAVTSRIARSASLALRLELDAAALVLEPLALQSPVARAIGATVLAPRARRVTRARVDGDREDAWIEEVPVDLAAVLAAIASVLGPREDASRDVARGAAVFDRASRAPLADAELETTLRIAHSASRVRTGEVEPNAGLDLIAPLVGARALPRLDRVVRALATASIAAHVDDARAREELDRAASIAADSGATLLDACAATALGALLAGSPARGEEGMAALTRASTLLANGDAPGLEHEAEHQRAIALVARGMWREAVAHLRAAREAAHAERAVEAELLSTSLEVAAQLASGAREAAREAAQALGDARLAGASNRSASLAWIARVLDALAHGELDRADAALGEAEARVREPATDGPDAWILVEALGLLLDAGRGELGDEAGAVSDLARFARERGFSGHHWMDVVRAAVATSGAARRGMTGALDRIASALGPTGRVARERDA